MFELPENRQDLLGTEKDTFLTAIKGRGSRATA
jgi:hypothetical protein